MSKKKFHFNKDPYAEREASKYQDPIPSREFILEFIKEKEGKASREAMIAAMALATEEQQEALRRRLRAMERDGQIVCNRQGLFSITSTPDLVRGKVVCQKDGNGGYVIPEEGDEWIVLPQKQMRGVFPNDVVKIRIHGVDTRGRLEGTIVDVLERHTTTLVGRFYTEFGVSYVVPEDSKIKHDILILPGDENGAQNQQYVTVEIKVQPTMRTQPIGRVREIMGEELSANTSIHVAVCAFHLPHEWPNEVENEVASLHESISAKDYEGRVDLRHLPLVTIDGEDAKDFDDAVYAVAKKRGGWTLYVAIADVSHYVRVGSALDREAMHRGNSVYFPGKVVPMLPEKLSNGLCSLKPKVDRLCLVCEMQLSETGKMTKFEFYPAVMHSKARLTYTTVAKMIAGRTDGVEPEHLAVLPEIKTLHQVYLQLHKERIARGAMDFDTIETRIVLSQQGSVEKVVPVHRNDAHRLIEECMLLANVATARFLLKSKIPSLYRVHDGPRTEKIADLRQFFTICGIRLGGFPKPSAGDLSAAMILAKARPDYSIIQTMVLRSMAQAIYSPENIGHFGLAYPAYTHYTSPIRRYPDLVVHRSIRHALDKKDKAGHHYALEELQQIGEQTSATERRADEASRDVVAALKCAYMHGHLGEEFDGVISGVMSFGLFVQIKDLYVDGLVHVGALKDDYYQYDSVRQILRGERSGRVYQLGDALRVKLVRVNLNERKIDFDLVARTAELKAGKKAALPIPGAKKSKDQSKRDKKVKAKAMQAKRKRSR